MTRDLKITAQSVTIAAMRCVYAEVTIAGERSQHEVFLGSNNTVAIESSNTSGPRKLVISELADPEYIHMTASKSDSTPLSFRVDRRALVKEKSLVRSITDLDTAAKFKSSVGQLLDELRELAPRRYKEVISCFSVVTYDPERLKLEECDGVLARADGVFAIDGSDFGLLAWVFLHEVDHRVLLKEGGKMGTEWAANNYADSVMRQLDRRLTDP